MFELDSGSFALAEIDHLNASFDVGNIPASLYSEVTGLKALRGAIAQRSNLVNSSEFTENNIIVTQGVSQALYQTCQELLSPEDEVIIPECFWGPLREYAELFQGTVKIIPTQNNNYRLTPEALDEHLSGNTRMFMFTNPNNPNGIVYDRTELAAFTKVLEQYPNVWILSDEIYELQDFESRFCSFASFKALKDRTIIVNGFSKSYGMSAYRVGYLIGPEWVVKAIAPKQKLIGGGPSVLSQQKAIQALYHTSEYKDIIKRVMYPQMNRAIQKLKEIPGIEIKIPQGTYYLHLDFKALFIKYDWAEGFLGNYLKASDISVTDGKHFGTPTSLRLNIAKPWKDLGPALDHFTSVLQKLENLSEHKI